MTFAKAVLGGDRPGNPEVAVDVLTNLCNQMVALHLYVLWYDTRILLEGRRDPKVVLPRTTAWDTTSRKIPETLNLHNACRSSTHKCYLRQGERTANRSRYRI